jgi:FtsX-like permease family protein
LRPVTRLATRVDRRTRLTAWAIAFACMVLVGSILLVGGLASGVDSVTQRFETGPHVYARGADLLGSTIDANALTGLSVPFEALRVHTATLEVNNFSIAVVVASIESHANGTVTVPFPASMNSVALDAGLVSEFLADTGRPVNGTANLTIFGTAHPGLPIAPPPSSRPAILPDTWSWIRPEMFVALSPSAGGPIQALLTDGPLDGGTVTRLGLTSIDPVGAVGFAHATVDEAAGPLILLTAVVAIVIALLVYATMSLEVHERTAEIRILRGLGASARTVAAVYEGQAMVLSVLGASLGSALGILAAHAIVAFASIAGLPNLVVLPLPGGAVLAAFAVALIAGATAGIVPVSRALSILRGPEAIPS